MDLSHLVDYAWALTLAWTGYIHKELNNKPSREELILRLDNLRIQLEEMKEDIKEVKERL